VTPTNATISGRNRSTFISSVVHPSTYSAGRRSSIPGLGRAIRFVIPNPHSGSLSSSLHVIGSGTSLASRSSFQNLFE